MKTELVIDFNLNGKHFWPNPPEKYNDFQYYHQHLFRFNCWLAVDTVNPQSRIVELFELRRNTIKAICDEFGCEPCNFRDYSCEGIAQWLKPYFSKVFVGEADNFGAFVY